MADYIEKAALMSHIKSESRRWGDDYDCLQILGDIEDFPAADVRPVRRGRWKIRAYGIDGEDVYCSVCECGSNKPYWPFCPMCGSDMRGGDAEWESTSFTNPE